jgi:hypothetical protein
VDATEQLVARLVEIGDTVLNVNSWWRVVALENHGDHTFGSASFRTLFVSASGPMTWSYARADSSRRALLLRTTPSSAGPLGSDAAPLLL